MVGGLGSPVKNFSCPYCVDRGSAPEIGARRGRLPVTLDDESLESGKTDGYRESVHDWVEAPHFVGPFRAPPFLPAIQLPDHTDASS